MRIRNKRKKLLYILLGLMILGTVGSFGGIQFVKYRFFGDSPNTLTFKGELHPVPFEWSEEQFDEYTEPHAAMLIPVTVPGLANKFYMQFDTGSASTFLRSGAMEPLRRRGIKFELFEEDDLTRVRRFELNIGGNQVFLNLGRVRGRDAEIDWDDPEAVNIIGTIGADFIDQKICEIDFPARELRLYESRPESSDSLGSFTPFKFKGRRIMLPAVIDGVEMELFYDSGCSAFGLLTSKYHFERYKNQDAEEISHNANRHGDPIFIHHQPCDSMVEFGNVDLPLKRVSYAELYTFLQNTVGRLVNGGILGNKSLIESTLILDAKANEFLIVPQPLQGPIPTAAKQHPSSKLESPVSPESGEAEPAFQIPFTLTEHNNISINAVLNDKHTLALMFHTGNSDVCLTKETTKKLPDLIFDQQGDANSWGGASSTSYCRGNSLQIGDRAWDDITVFEDRLSGRGTDGKFGPDLFKGKVIEIDFDRQILVVHDSLPEIATTFKRFDCRQHRNSMFINGELQIGEETISNEFMIHSGFGGTILLDDEFVSLNNLDRLETISESELRDSFGNVLKTKKVVLPRLSFGDSSFSNIPISFFDGAIGKQKMSVVGGDVLKRFNIIIIGSDRSQVYLKPNRHFDLKFGT